MNILSNLFELKEARKGVVVLFKRYGANRINIRVKLILL